jgi:hypothetical protein
MSRWEPGAADIEQALKQRTLQAITGAAADGESLLIKAERTITTARDKLEPQWARAVGPDPYNQTRSPKKPHSTSTNRTTYPTRTDDRPL